MKKSIILTLAALLFTAAVIAQDDHGHDHSGKELAGEEWTVEVDPFGNIVETYHDPVNPEWTPGLEEVDVELIDPLQYMKEAAEQAERHSKAGLKNVRVFLAVDTEYMASNPDWLSRTLTVFNGARPSFLLFGQINLVFAGWLPWDSNGTTNSAILSDLASDFSNFPDGLVVGFTADSNFTAGGKAYVYSGDPGLGFSVVYDQSVNSTTYALRHEIAHNYGMSHDYDPTICMMNYTYAYDVIHWDPAHQVDLLTRNTRFGAW